MGDYSESNKVRNWKVATESSPYKYNGVDYKIDVRSKLSTKILNKTLEQLTVARNIHKRILVMRFDLRSGNFKNSNEEISLFRKCIIQWIERHYQTHSIGTLWVRERETVKQQHYHFAIWIDGNKIKHSRKLKLIIQHKWEEIDPGNHSAWNCENGAYLVDNDSIFHDAVFRLSYMAKLRGKGYRNQQDNDYSTSRLKLKGDDMKRRLAKLEAKQPVQKVFKPMSEMTREELEEKLHIKGLPSNLIDKFDLLGGNDVIIPPDFKVLDE